MKIKLNSPNQGDEYIRYSGGITIKNEIEPQIYFDIPPLSQTEQTKPAQEDSFYLIGNLLAEKLNIYFSYPEIVSPMLYSAMPQIVKILGLNNKSLIKKAYHHIKSRLLHSAPTPRKIFISSTTNDIGQFFTLGLDSFYTFFCLGNKPKYLVYVEGFDVENSRQVLMKKIRDTISIVASNSKVLFIRSNLREITDKIVNWEQIHGAACASVAYYTSPWINTIYTNNVKSLGKASSYWGSGPHLDPLFSTEYMSIKSFGHDKNRLDKAFELSKHKDFDLVLKYVRPCWRNDNKGLDEFNCCNCEKCARTYLALVAATGTMNIPAFETFSLNNLDAIKFQHNPETQLSWQSIYMQLSKKFGESSKIAVKSRRFTY